MVTLLSELDRFRTNEKYKRDGWIPLRPNPCYMSTCRIRFRSPFAKKKREREKSAEMVGVQVQPVSSIRAP